MADQIFDQVRDAFEGQIDFEGQRLADFLTNWLLAITGLISFVTGFFLQDIVRALVFGLLGTALTFLVVVPPWPMYNRRPVKWLKVQKNQTSTVTINGEEVEL